jgi:2-succinyl-5-enolpyruvyl-6-hydroxy-3-cyclohexene-1-carboxylate synthase
MNRDATTAFARTLVDEWVRAGVAHAALAPGSRSTPVALALAREDRMRVHVLLDERSAAFFGLGAAKATGQPAVVLCTSGTASANFHPAVLEAHHSRVPLLVCTADRPPELRDTGAGQTVDQQRLYGDAVRWFVDAGVPEDTPDAGRYWRSLAARAVVAALGPPAGPVHLNLPFREPLVPTGTLLVEAPGRAGGRPWATVTPPHRAADDATLARLTTAVQGAPRGLVVAGWGPGATPTTVTRFATAAGWPVLADVVSGLRAGAQAVSTYEALLRSPGFGFEHRPELILRLGATPTSKMLAGWLDAGVAQVHVDPDLTWHDPARAVCERIAVEPEALLTAVADRLDGDRRSSWLHEWLGAEATARAALDDVLDSWDMPFEGRVARDVVAALPDGATLVIASSMPVRDVEAFARPRTGVRFLANRGVNGIDGFNAAVLGVAAANVHAPTVALVGDLCFLHDSNALLGVGRRGLNATFVVVDNDGGGIFSFLPQSELPEHFEELFGTPHGIDLVALAELHHIPVERIEKASDLVPALDAAVAAGGVRIIVVPSDRADNVSRHRDAWSAVARSLAGAFAPAQREQMHQRRV